MINLSLITSKDLPAKTAEKRVGILTSGGDCAGLNAAIRGATLAASQHGWEVVGILNSTEGLLSRPLDCVMLTPEVTGRGFLFTGGTALGSMTANPKNGLFTFDENGKRHVKAAGVAEGYHMLGLDALIVIGGDGSFRILRQVAAEHDLKIVAIPKTIDNDVTGTDLAIGFATAVQVVTDALDQLRPTITSHQRTMVIEVMGRDAGHIALEAGISGGADVILIPELADYSLDRIAQHLDATPRKHGVIVVSEAVKTLDGDAIKGTNGKSAKRYGGIGAYLAEKLAEETGRDTRSIALGHLQRGGQAVARDRLLATRFGAKAISLIAEGYTDHMVALRDHKVVSMPLADLPYEPRLIALDSPLIQVARDIGICLG